MAELACRCQGRFCAGAYWHGPGFLDRLQALRDEVAEPLHVCSGHRCAQWNAFIGGAARSRHKQIAVDLSLYGLDRHAVLRAARKHGFRGIGLAQSFIHLDRRQIPATWYYGRSRSAWQT
ncbi:MAG: D-Ala-D-Ala carboxypeptidase family metallohydrolase [Henriciella sp.]